MLADWRPQLDIGLPQLSRLYKKIRYNDFKALSLFIDAKLEVDDMRDYRTDPYFWLLELRVNMSSFQEHNVFLEAITIPYSTVVGTVAVRHIHHILLSWVLAESY